MSFREDLEKLRNSAADVEKAARGLANQNLADVIHDGVVKLEQALQHPDIENVGKSPDEVNQGILELQQAEQPTPDPLDPGTQLQAQEAARRAAMADEGARVVPPAAATGAQG